MVRRLGLERAVGVDIGGTSADISVVQATGWDYAVRPTIEGVTVSLPVLGVESVGQGGGSIARVRDGVLSVGPDSAGAYPGPAAFALGGDRATVTDAAAALGLFDAAGFLGGRKRLDLEAARAAVLRDVATPLGVDVWEAARRILATTAAAIARHVEAHLGRRGLRPDATALFATGGAGGLLADAIGRALGARERYAFKLSPVFSAYGLSGLPVAHAYDLPADGPGEAATLGDLAARARRDMRSEGVTTSDLEFSLEVEVDGHGVWRMPLGRGDPGSLARAEGALVGRRDRLARLRASAPAPSSSAPAPSSAPDASARQPGPPRPAAGDDPAPRSARDVAWAGAPEATPVYDWSTLPPGASIVGPALIESSETTVAVPPGSVGRAGDHGEVRFDDAG
jgi:N-methylhydantoinase A/oxoprolinase/acetone carboxylase beta subunit